MRIDVRVSPDMVKAEAQRRIIDKYPLWRQLNMSREDTHGIDAMHSAIDAIRAASNKLESLDPIPGDYTSDRHWPN